MNVKLLIAVVFVLVLSDAVNSRRVRDRNRGREPTLATVQTNEPSYQALSDQYEELSRRFEILQRQLESAISAITQLSGDVSYVRDEINTLNEDVPVLLRSDEVQSRTLSDIEDRLSEGCSCNGNGGGRGETGPSQGRNSMDGWVSNLDRDFIHGMRQNINRGPSAGRNADDDEEEEEEADNEVNVDPDVVKALGKAFADMMTPRVVENAGRNGINIVRSHRPHASDSIAQQPTAVANPSVTEKETTRGFPFRRQGRSISHRHRRELTEDEVYTQMERTFTDLVKSNKKCAFSSIRTQPLLGLSDTPQLITFQKNTANKGKAFERGKGLFTCSIPGIYYFSYTMRSYDHKHIGVALMLNDGAVVAMTTDASDRKVMQTQSAMIQLVEGDQVWLLLGPSEDFGLYGNDFNYNTFNGQLLYPNYI
ncbi:uncharacterized protein LOC144442345 [Glandiceps talaboti]